MSDVHKYYYIKLKENFFNLPKIEFVRKGNKSKGDTYIIILLMMYLTSLKYNGALLYGDSTPISLKELSVITGYSEKVLTAAIEQLRKYDLIEEMPDGTIYMKDIQECIGKSSSEADRKRRYRAELKDKKVKQRHTGQSSPVCIPENQGLTDECPPKKEIDTETDIETDIETDTKNKYHSFVGGGYHTCPKCGQRLIERKLNGHLAWCHHDGHLPHAKCSAIFNSVAEIKGYSELPGRNR